MPISTLARPVSTTSILRRELGGSLRVAHDAPPNTSRSTAACRCIGEPSSHPPAFFRSFGQRCSRSHTLNHTLGVKSSSPILVPSDLPHLHAVEFRAAGGHDSVLR